MREVEGHTSHGAMREGEPRLTNVEEYGISINIKME
jgi:hypothetical protein